MKVKLSIILLLLALFLVSPLVVYASTFNEYNTYVSEAELYEKTIEANINGKLDWSPIGVSDFEAKNKDTKLGKSTSKDSTFRYFYDSGKMYLIQYFKVKKKQGVVIWEGGEIISYEIFN